MPAEADLKTDTTKPSTDGTSRSAQGTEYSRCAGYTVDSRIKDPRKTHNMQVIDLKGRTRCQNYLLNREKCGQTGYGANGDCLPERTSVENGSEHNYFRYASGYIRCTRGCKLDEHLWQTIGPRVPPLSSAPAAPGSSVQPSSGRLSTYNWT